MRATFFTDNLTIINAFWFFSSTPNVRPSTTKFITTFSRVPGSPDQWQTVLTIVGFTAATDANRVFNFRRVLVPRRHVRQLAQHPRHRGQVGHQLH
ncbi:hypothetical protein KHV-MN_00034 [Cyprinid herpesvirus 3]|nr:hypothetical protein KHV-MN_00034 [Cyprinid herpesvirus 3]